MRYKKKLAVKALLIGLLSSVYIAAAGAGEVSALANYSTDEEKKEGIKEEKPDGEPFSVPGNAELLDDVTGDDSKQFITVRTKNNQTFFVVIDRQGSAQNVYMLSMIDENDLEKFLDEEEKDKGVLTIPEEKEEDEVNATADVKPEVKEKRGNGGLIAALLFIVVIVGAYYFLKIRPKRKKESDKIGNSDEEDSQDEYDDSYEDESNEYDGEPEAEENVDNEESAFGGDNGGEVYYEEEPQEEKPKSRHRRHHNRRQE